MKASPRPASDRLAHALAVVAVAGAASWTAVAAAQTSATPSRGDADATLEAARASFAEGLELERQERWAEALDRFRRASTVRAAAPVLFHIGLCEERLGNDPEALTAFEAAWTGAHAEGAGEVVKALPPHLSRLRATLARVSVRAPADSPNAEISIDDRAVAADAVIGVRPGTHRASAKTASGILAAQQFQVDAGAERTIELLPAPAARQPAPVPTADRAAATPGIGPMRVTAVAVGGAGALSLGAAGLFFALRGDALDDVRAGCGGKLSGCPESVRPAFDRGKDYTTAGNVLLGVGAAGLGAGVALFLMGKPAPRARAGRAAPSTQWISGAPGSPAGASIRRSF